MSDPVAVILAAGRAERMGRPKQLLPYRDTTVLGAVVEAAGAAGFSRPVVVLGAYADEVRRVVDLAGCEVVVNPDPDRGNLSSLRVAAAITADAPVLLLMGDMPGIEPTVLAAHVEAHRREARWLRTTDYEDGIGHPFLLSAELMASLDDLGGSKPLWALTADERATSLEVAGPMPVDVDTPEDYEEALGRHVSE